MAVLQYHQIRKLPSKTINYIANGDKMVSPLYHDVHTILSCLSEPTGIERVFPLTRHCSPNPTLAAAQMDLYCAKYRESKYGDNVPGLKKGSPELLGLHFIISYTTEDNPSEEVMNAITTALAEHPRLRDFPMYSANHFNTDHKHTHVYLCQYCATGSPRKLCLRYQDFYALRKHLNRLCVQHRLSIIDLSALRYNDPQYAAWIDGVIAEGQITVHRESDEHKRSPHQKSLPRSTYYKWMVAQEDALRLAESRLTANQLNAKKVMQTYFWNFQDSPKHQAYYISNDPKKRYYAVRRYDEYGRKRTLVELICMLVIIIYKNEMARRAPPSSPVCHIIQARVDKNIQAMVDCIAIAREMHTATPEDVATQLRNTWQQIEALTQETRRLEALIPDDQSPEQFQFRQRKIQDYTQRLRNLQRQYRGLKRLQALIAHPERIAAHSYHYQPVITLDDQIRSARQKKEPEIFNTQKATYEHYQVHIAGNEPLHDCRRNHSPPCAKAPQALPAGRFVTS